ncbi:MAG: riboflavin synthase [Acidimicrobiales bacterium]
MFTGIVEELGRFAGREGNRFTFDAPVTSADAAVGDSIAVNGACLTVVSTDGRGSWQADVVDETLARTNLGRLTPGDPVNLERPLRLSDRLDGHLVQGHVDAVGDVVEPAPDLRIALHATEGLRYVATKGSIAVDGVSLTVVDVLANGLTVAVIPHTAAVTTLGQRRPGDPVNLEFDIIAKYVARLLGE